MPSTSSAIDYYLGLCREGRHDEAFFGLLELDHDVLLALMEAYRAEPDAEIRALLVEVIWQHRQPSANPFLAQVLQNPEPEIWKRALDGLVAMASSESLDALHTARESGDGEFRKWVEEAIGQVREQLHARQDT